MPRIVLNPERVDEKILELQPGESTIGRGEDNAVFVLHRSLSRRHARIILTGEQAVIEDLASKNGTFVQGARITRVELRSGDIIRCGDVLFRFERDDAVVSTPTIAVDMSKTHARTGILDLLRQDQAARTALRVQATDAAQRDREKLRILLQVSEILSSPEPIGSLLEKILDLAFRILDLDHAEILLVNEATGTLDASVARNSPRAPAQHASHSRHIVEYVRRNKVAALFSDARADPRLGPAESLIQQSICASMCAPLKPKDDVLGVLYVDNRTIPNRFQAEDLDFLAAFANQAAIAIENATLFSKLEREAVLRNSFLRFFPPAAIKKLMASPEIKLGAVETEVTAVFVDISGFTAMCSEMAPGRVVEMLNAYFPFMADVVFRHEGTLEKYIGDALMALWGAPFAHDDDADRAVHAAVEMFHAMRAFNQRWDGGRRIEIHAGVNTGCVAVGNIGTEQYLQYAAIGDTTNVTSRICSVAATGELLISASTFDKLRNVRWPIEKLAPVQVKGKAAPLELYRVRWDG